MKKFFICLICILTLAGCAPPRNSSSNREERSENIGVSSGGVWISYSEVNSMLKSENGFRAEFDRVIQSCREAGLGEIYLHIRSHCDSLFKSDYFPQNKFAKELDYDPFEYAVDKCRSNGIKIHAWINPYRVNAASDDITALDKDSPAYKWLNDDNTENDVNVVRFGGIYLNPAESAVRELIINGIRELLSKYTVDGVHFDDYFYPTTDAAFDKASYEKYCADAKNPIALDDWRRANVNTLLAGCRAAIKSIGGERVDFSISPAASIEKNYSEYYADVKLWVKDGIVDTIIPQLYFGFEYPSREFCFDNLMDSWAELAAENKAIKLAVGLAPYKLGTDSEPDSAEWKNGTDIVARQIKACLDSEAVTGYVLFSYTSVFSDSEQAHEQLDKIKEATAATNSQQQQSVQ